MQAVMTRVKGKKLHSLYINPIIIIHERVKSGFILPCIYGTILTDFYMGTILHMTT